MTDSEKIQALKEHIEQRERIIRKYIQSEDERIVKMYMIEGFNLLRIKEIIDSQEECGMCTETGGFYLGTTCPKCLKPFRSVNYIIEE